MLFERRFFMSFLAIVLVVVVFSADSSIATPPPPPPRALTLNVGSGSSFRVDMTIQPIINGENLSAVTQSFTQASNGMAALSRQINNPSSIRLRVDAKIGGTTTLPTQDLSIGQGGDTKVDCSFTHGGTAYTYRFRLFHTTSDQRAYFSLGPKPEPSNWLERLFWKD